MSYRGNCKTPRPRKIMAQKGDFAVAWSFPIASYKSFIPLSLLFFSFNIQECDKFYPALHPHQTRWEGHSLHSSDITTLTCALDQPYTYLGRGGQATAFVSQDGQFVIKFFKQKKLEDCRDQTFSSYTIAFDELTSESQLIYIHLNSTNHLKKSIRLSDSTGKERWVELDTCDFVVQRRAVLPLEYLQDLMKRGHREEAQQAIDQLIQIIQATYKKGVRNRDPNIIKNYGFIQGAPVLIDAGRLVKCKNHKEKARYHKKLKRSLYRLQEWLDSHFPELKVPEPIDA